MNKINQPTPKPNMNISYVCKYETEIDRNLVLDNMGHYIESVLGTREILFIKAPMDAINKVFSLNLSWPGEEIEFVVDHKNNTMMMTKKLVGEELPALWAVLTNEATGINIITTVEPCKFIIDKNQLEAFESLMATVEIAPKQYNYEALNAVHWNETNASLKRDIEFFAHGKKFFDSRNMAYSRSYLLHGPPGNGKTTTIKAIAKFFNTKPESFDFSAQMKSPDKQFQSWVLGESERIERNEIDDDDVVGTVGSNDYADDGEAKKKNTPIRLLVLEDIDRLFPNDGTKHTSVSLQAVLQALDGAIERRNVVIIATANAPKSLDQQVLARPGRFDKQIFYSQPDEAQALSYLKKLFEGENVDENALKTACARLKGHSYALHKELFATAASYAIEKTSKVIDTDDVLNGLQDLVKHLDEVVMKSERQPLGFND